MTTQKGHNRWIGLEAHAFIPLFLFSLKNIATATVFEFSAPPSLQERAKLSHDELATLLTATGLHEGAGIPFWDAVLLTCSDSEKLPRQVLSAASYHRSPDEGLRHLDLKDVTEETLRKLASRTAPRHMLALSSAIEMRGGARKHIPMLDFGIQSSSSALRVVLAVIGQLGLDGAVLNSGSSFHFYGNKLLSDDELTRFLGRALLYSPIVDRRWIAHQLIEGGCALRISRSTSSGLVPRVVAYVGLDRRVAAKERRKRPGHGHPQIPPVKSA
jgi:hypothetical protein